MSFDECTDRRDGIPCEVEYKGGRVVDKSVWKVIPATWTEFGPWKSSGQAYHTPIKSTSTSRLKVPLKLLANSVEALFVPLYMFYKEVRCCNTKKISFSPSSKRKYCTVLRGISWVGDPLTHAKANCSSLCAGINPTFSIIPAKALAWYAPLEKPKIQILSPGW